MFESIVRWLLMLFLSAISTLLLPALYLIKSSYFIFHIREDYDLYINVGCYLGLPFLLSYLSLLILQAQQKDSIAHAVKEVRPVNNEYLPIYLGYIFVSLSLPNPQVGQIDLCSLLIVYSLICLFVTCSKSLCFNPIYVIYGYAYYRITTNSNISVFIISRRKFHKSEQSITFPKLRKITETVFIDR